MDISCPVGGNRSQVYGRTAEVYDRVPGNQDVIAAPGLDAFLARRRREAVNAIVKDLKVVAQRDPHAIIVGLAEQHLAAGNYAVGALNGHDTIGPGAAGVSVDGKILNGEVVGPYCRDDLLRGVERIRRTGLEDGKTRPCASEGDVILGDPYVCV